MFIVPESSIAELMTRSAAYKAIEEVFSRMANKSAYNFPVIREAIGFEDALYGFKSGFDRKGEVLGVKAGGYWPHNLERRGEINHQSSIFLFHPNNGKLHAIVGGNLLTALRTAAASAISIQYLARKDAKVLGMIGAGHQSVFQMQAALEQRHFEKVVAWNRSPQKLDRLRDLATEAGVAFEAVELDGMLEADVIVTITSNFEPILMSKHVRAGTHIACMGTDTKGKQEIDAALIGSATVFTDEVEQSGTIGEAQHAVSEGLIKVSDLVELGSVINGDHSGRRSEDEITIFDGTGVGLQDLAVAARVVALAIENRVATEIDF